jgi:hypothetical protein
MLGLVVKMQMSDVGTRHDSFCRDACVTSVLAGRSNSPLGGHAAEGASTGICR